MTILQFPKPGGSNWNDTIRRLPYAHILQSEEWAAIKQRQTGWQPEKVLFRDQRNTVIGAAMVLTRRVGPLVVMYVPKGPMLDYADQYAYSQALDRLQKMARQRRAIWLKIDPDVVAATGEPTTPEAADTVVGQSLIKALQGRKWRFSNDQVQFRNSITIDLTRTEDEILAGMGQGKRRKVRYGPRHGVSVRAGGIEDLPVLYQLYSETGKRDGFLTRPYEYYVDEWGTMIKAGMAHVLIAEVENKPIAHVILFHFGKTCWYFTGASVSDNEIRKLMPADLLQWEAMRWAKAQGYAVYDMYGAPNVFDDSDPMWGVYQFKKDYGGTLVRHIGAWDYVPFPPLYFLYARVMPGIIGFMRGRARRAQGIATTPKSDQPTPD